MAKTTIFTRRLLTSFVFSFMLFSAKAFAVFPEVVKDVTPSVVAIGLYTPLEANGNQVLGTGFVVADGKHVVTNYHVVSKILDPAIVQYFVVISGEGRDVKTYKAEVLGIDPVHDLAVLKFEGKLQPINLAEGALLPPGTDVAFTGFPIGAAIGLYPATHKGMISAITPDAIPAQNADQLTVSMLKRLKQPELVYQLDATAYPGNSGSPVYDVKTGHAVGVINKVFVSQGKESALSAPSGISYAIPITHALSLLKQHGL